MVSVKPLCTSLLLENKSDVSSPKQIVPHTLRHTGITHSVQAGVDLPRVKRISGHKTLIM